MMFENRILKQEQRYPLDYVANLQPENAEKLKI